MRRAFFIIFTCFSLWTGCSNSPYPLDSLGDSVHFDSFAEPPKTLDPAVAYTTNASRYLVLTHETLFEYHYLKRPLELIPGLAKRIPTPRRIELSDGSPGVAYTFEIWENVFYHEDPCFATPDDPTGSNRELLAQDFVFALKRLADFEVNCPVYEPFSKILGFREWTDRLQTLRKEDPSFSRRAIGEQYVEAGKMEGLSLEGEYGLRIVLKEPYPQILYWMAMHFSSPVPFEAVEYYDGEEGRDSFAEHPIGTGPYRMVNYDKTAKITLKAHPRWRGQTYPERKAPGTVYPGQEATLPFIQRLEYRLEKETMARFNKFLQGYYDSSGIPKESFGSVVVQDNLSESMRRKGIRLYKSTGLDIFYIGFNMDDDVVGSPQRFQNPAKENQRNLWLERNKKLRQAMSLAYDAENELQIFANGRGIPAQSPLPPGIFGYDPNRLNPFRAFDPKLERAKQLLREAGYENGIDPSTQAPLELHFDVGSTDSRARIFYQYHVDCWRKLGLDVRLEATNYNQFQQKMREGSYQIFRWGWVADYPDPENFLFLLYGPMGRVHHHGPNSANFNDPEYNALFEAMKSLANDEAAPLEDGTTLSRGDIIGKMLAIVEEECPWIPVSHSEAYAIVHEWYGNIEPPPIACCAMKYRTLDPALRLDRVTRWNQPNLIPLVLLFFTALLILVPGIRTYLRERQ